MRKKTSFKLCIVLELGTIVNNRNIKQGKNKKEFWLMSKEQYINIYVRTITYYIYFTYYIYLFYILYIFYKFSLSAFYFQVLCSYFQNFLFLFLYSVNYFFKNKR